MTLAQERLDDAANLKLVGLLEAGDPKGQVCNAWHAKEVVRSVAPAKCDQYHTALSRFSFR